jgi:hypothetical protein
MDKTNTPAKYFIEYWLTAPSGQHFPAYTWYGDEAEKLALLPEEIAKNNYHHATVRMHDGIRYTTIGVILPLNSDTVIRLKEPREFNL